MLTEPWEGDLEGTDRVRITRRVFAAVALALAFWAAAAHSERSVPPRRTEPHDLRITHASPIGEVRKLDSIDLVFSEPMIEGDRRGRAGKGVPLEFEPKIDGEFFWIGSRAVSFFPREEIPPGTDLVCRVPKGTRASEGKELINDYVWRITIGRPELLATEPAEGGRIGSNGLLYLSFSLPPAQGAERFVHLMGPNGEIPTQRVAIDPTSLPDRFGGSDRTDMPVHLFALEPEALEPRTRYKLVIDPAFPFAGSDVGLMTERTLRFRTYGEPKLLTVTGYGDGLLAEFAAPIDRDALLRHLVIEQGPTSFGVAPDSGTTFHLSGDFERGRSYTFRLRAGLPSLHGEALSSDQILGVTVAHVPASLRIVPDAGVLPRGTDSVIRLTATNIDSVEISGAWIDPDSVAPRLLRKTLLLTDRLEKIGTWNDPGLAPDSARHLDLPLSLLGRPPRGGQAAALRIRGDLLFPTARQVPTRLEAALVQVSDLALSVHLEDEAGIAWVTRLSNGKSCDHAEIRLFIRAKVQPVWQTETDADGLASIPGWTDIGLTPGSAIVLQARTNDDAVWLPMTVPEAAGARVAASHDSLELRGLLWTDREVVRPGETLRWVACARRIGRGRVVPAGIDSLWFRINGKDRPGWRSQGSFAITPPGNGAGQVMIPIGATAGPYELILTDESAGGGAGIASRRIEVIDPMRVPYDIQIDARPEFAVSGSTVELAASFHLSSGAPAAYAPVRWTLRRRPDRSRPDRFGSFSFGDSPTAAGVSGSDRARAEAVVAGETARLDRRGRITVLAPVSLEGLDDDQIYSWVIDASGPTGEAVSQEIPFRVRRSSLRVGARAQLAADPQRSTVEFTAIAVDSSDRAIPGVELRWSISTMRRNPDAARPDSILMTGEWTTTAEPVTMEWQPPRPGFYAFSVEGIDPLGRATGAMDRIEVPEILLRSLPPTPDDRAILEPEREVHAPGDTARVRLRAPPIPSEAIVLLLDEGIRKVRRLSNLRGSPSLLVPLEGFDPPGAWLRVTVVGPTINPHDVDTMRKLPPYRTGQIYLPIRDEAHALRVTVESDREVASEDEELLVRIRLEDGLGRALPGDATLAIVAERNDGDTTGGRPDLLSALFPMRDDGTVEADTRSGLHLPAHAAEPDLPAPAGERGKAATQPPSSSYRSIDWKPLIQVGADGEAAVPVRVRGGPGTIRIGVLGTSGADRFGYGEARVRIRESFRLDSETPPFLRETDELEVVTTVEAESEGPIEVQLVVEAEGAQIEGKTRRKWKQKPGQSTESYFRLQHPSQGGVSLRLRAEGAGWTDSASITIPVERPVIWDRSFIRGRAAPGFRTTVETSGDPLPDLGGLTTVISPSILSGLEGAIETVLRARGEGLEALSNRLLASSTKEILFDYLGILDETATATPQEPIPVLLSKFARCVRSNRIDRWPAADSPEASDSQVAFALYCLAGTRAGSSAALIERLDHFAEERLRRLRETSSTDLALAQLLEQVPWLIWARTVAGQRIESNADSTLKRDLGPLLSRHKTAPVESKIVMGLILSNLLESSDGTDRRGWQNLLEILIQEIKAERTNRKGRHVWVSASAEGDTGGSGDDERATALFLHLLAVSDSWDEDLPGMVMWLLEKERSGAGAWSNDHATALVLDQIVAAAARLEGPRTDVSGKLGIGSRFEDFLFRRGGAVQIRRETPIAELLSPDGEARPLQVRVDTDGRRSIYVTTMLEEARSGLSEPPRENGILIDRQFLTADTRRPIQTTAVGEPVLVRLSIVLFEDATALEIIDPLPAGLTVPSLVPWGEALRIVHKQQSDREVGLYAEEVPAGVHHIYYQAVAITAGRFHVPGARVELTNRPQTYGTSAPQEIKIERGP